MKESDRQKITVSVQVNAPLEVVWKHWTTPEDIMRWNNASGDWHTPQAQNDLRPGGRFIFRMEARDGSEGFDFDGVYDSVRLHQSIVYTMGDGRKAQVMFSAKGRGTSVTETFEAETENSVDLQRSGWQSILNNFKNYVEGRS